MILAPMAILLAQGCIGDPEPDAYTRQGFAVYDESPMTNIEALSDLADLEGAVATEIMGADALGLLYELGDGVGVLVSGECLDERCAYAGLTSLPDAPSDHPDAWVRIYWPEGVPCVATTAWGHELIHVQLLALWGDADVAHLEGWAWHGPGSIQGLTHDRGLREVCGRG